MKITEYLLVYRVTYSKMKEDSDETATHFIVIDLDEKEALRDGFSYALSVAKSFNKYDEIVEMVYIGPAIGVAQPNNAN